MRPRRIPCARLLGALIAIGLVVFVADVAEAQPRFLVEEASILPPVEEESFGTHVAMSSDAELVLVSGIRILSSPMSTAHAYTRGSGDSGARTMLTADGGRIALARDGSRAAIAVHPEGGRAHVDGFVRGGAWTPEGPISPSSARALALDATGARAATADLVTTELRVHARSDSGWREELRVPSPSSTPC